MRNLIIATAALASVAGIAFAQTDKSQPMNDISVGSAKIEGNTVTGVTVNIDKPGYLVIHDQGAGAPPANLGFIAVAAGQNSNISIEGTSALADAKGLSLMLHYETNGNTSYDFGPGSTDVDTPVMAGSTAVSVMMGM